MLGTLPKIEKATGAKMKYTNWIKQLIMEFLVDLTSEYKRVYEIGSRYPDISLTLLKQAFSHAVFDNKKEVDIFDFEDAILNSKNVYPDVIKKDMPIFYEKFKDIIAEEKGEPRENAPEWDITNRTITTPVYDEVIPNESKQTNTEEDIYMSNFERDTLVAPQRADYESMLNRNIEEDDDIEIL